MRFLTFLNTGKLEKIFCMRSAPRIVKTYVVIENDSPGATLHAKELVNGQFVFHLVALSKNLKIAVFVIFLRKW